MSFHPGGHKPKLKPIVARAGFGPKLLLGACGAAFALFGLQESKNGSHFWLNRLNQPVYPASAIVIGAVLLTSALVPWSWLDRVTRRLCNPRGPERTPTLRK